MFLNTYCEFPVPQPWNNRNMCTLRWAFCMSECMRIHETQLKFSVCNGLGGTAMASCCSLNLSKGLLEVCLQMLKSFTQKWIGILSLNTREIDTFIVFCSKISSRRCYGISTHFLWWWHFICIYHISTIFLDPSSKKSLVGIQEIRIRSAEELLKNQIWQPGTRAALACTSTERLEDVRELLLFPRWKKTCCFLSLSKT